MDNNVFNYGKYSWRYPIGWWKNITMFPRHVKWAWQRVTRGYADCDVWNMHGWLLNIMSGALNQLADTCCGWPGTEEFPTDKDWVEYLKSIAQKFYSANEDNEYYPIPEFDKWSKWCDEHRSIVVPVSNVLNPYNQTMLDESKENADKRMRDFAEAWSMMGEVFFDLWD